jgi:phosphatidylethanolamine-binding protein (PEBP) family uncharacterized protein
MPRLSATLALLALAGCASTGSYRPVAAALPGIDVHIDDPHWDGKHIPPQGICSNYGGRDLSPALRVSDVPAGANAIIVQFNDLDHPARASNGGHGAIGYWVDAGVPARLPSVQGYSVRLPEGAFIERGAQANGPMASQGYLAPCSGGRGHRYVADVLAVRKATAAGEQNLVLARTRLPLGRY